MKYKKIKKRKIRVQLQNLWLVASYLFQHIMKPKIRNGFGNLLKLFEELRNFWADLKTFLIALIKWTFYIQTNRLYKTQKNLKIRLTVIKTITNPRWVLVNSQGFIKNQIRKYKLYRYLRNKRSLQYFNKKLYRDFIQSHEVRRLSIISRRLLALVVIGSLVFQISLPGGGLDFAYITRTKAEETHFTETNYANFLFEHKDNQYSTYFGDKNDKGKHIMRFETNGKSAEISLLGTLNQHQEDIKQIDSHQEESGETTSSASEPSTSAHLNEINEELKEISEETERVSEKIKEIEKDVEEIGKDVEKIAKETIITHIDAVEVVKTFESAPGIDILYALIDGGLKEEIVIKHARALKDKSSLYFSLDLEGLYFAKPPAEDEWLFLDEDANRELFYFEKPFAIDAHGNRTEDIDLIIREDSSYEGQHLIVLRLDSDWFSDPARVYPITIDPTIRLSKQETLGSSIRKEDGGGIVISRGKRTINFKNIEANPTATHRFEARFYGGGRVLISDKQDKSVGYKIISGYDKDFWLEFKMLDSVSSIQYPVSGIDNQNNEATESVSINESTPSADISESSESASINEATQSASIGEATQSAQKNNLQDTKYQIPDTRIIQNQEPTVREGQYGKNKVVFKPKDFLEVEYEILADRVKANYILTQTPDTKYQLLNTRYFIPFSLTYPWGVTIPQADENDGSISFYTDKFGDGKEAGGGAILTILPPVAKDNAGKTIPTFLELSSPPSLPPLPAENTDGILETLSLNLLFELDGSETYPITIDPVVIDSTTGTAATAYGNSRNIIRDNQGNGNLIAFFLAGTSSGDIYTSSDGGISWTSMGVSGPYVSVTTVSMAQDAAGDLHTILQDTSNFIVYKKGTVTRTNGNITSISISPSAPLGNGAEFAQYRPSIIVDAGNNLPAVAWALKTSGGTKGSRIQFSRAKGDPTNADNWTCAAEASCTDTDCNGASPGSPQCDEIGKLTIHTDMQAVLVQMPGVIEPLSGAAGNLYVYFNDLAGSDGGDLRVAKATIQTLGTPSFKWSSWSVTTEQASDLDTTRYQDLTAARDIRNKRIVFAFTTDANTDKGAVPVTQIRYRSASDDSTTDISPSTVFSTTGSGTDIGDEFQLTADPVRNEYLLFYANSSNNIEYRKVNPDANGGGTFGWKNETPTGLSTNLNSVDIYSSTLAFAVGNSNKIYKWNGSSWINDTPAASTRAFESVDVYSPSLAIAVGGTGSGESLIWRWNGTSWTNETPGGEGNAFRSVDVFSTSLAYAVGDTGRIYRWNGTSWTNERPPGETYGFNSVDVFSTSLAIAVGDAGVIYRWNGTSWINEWPEGEVGNINSVDVYSTSLAYAVGGSLGSTARIFRWNGTSWINESSPGGETYAFWSVDIYSTSLAYLVGTYGRIYRWNGTSWINETQSAGSQAFFSVDLYSSSLAYAVGNAGIYRWNGTSWTNETPAGETNTYFNLIDVYSTSLAYAVGDAGRIYKWTGGTIKWPVDKGTEQTYPAVPEMKYPGDNEPFPMLQTLSSALDVEYERVYPNLSDAASPLQVIQSADDAEHNDIDAGGDTQSITGTTVKLGRDNTNTRNYHTGFRFQGVSIDQGDTISSAYLTVAANQRTGTSSVPFTIYGEDEDGITSSSLAYAVGEYGSVWRWDGNDWIDEEEPSGYTGWFNSVDVNSFSLAYAVGPSGGIFKWNGSSWINESQPDGFSGTFYSVDVYSDILAYAVGTSGRIFKWNGTNWINEQPSGETVTFSSIDIYNQNLAYVVGDNGNIYKWNGSSWSEETPSSTDNGDDFNSVDVYSSELVYAVGGNGGTLQATIYKWNGTSWSNERPQDETNEFQSVDIYSQSLAYTVGYTGRIYKWNGTNWTNERPSTESDYFESVDVYSTSLAYAAGWSGTIYRWNGTSWINESHPDDTYAKFRTVDIFSTALAFVGGDNGEIWKWNGTNWSNDEPSFGNTDEFSSIDIYNYYEGPFGGGNDTFVGNHTRTSRSKSYSINFPASTNGVSYRWDVTDMVQEIACRGAAASLPCIGDYEDTSGSWASGNAMTMLLISTDASAANNYVQLNAQDGSEAIKSTLEINVADASGKNYSRGVIAAAPSTSDPPSNLSVSFSEQNYTNVGTNDTAYADITNVAQATNTRDDTPAFYFKRHHTNNSDNIDVTWIGQSTIAASDKTVYLEVYNDNSVTWENQASNSSASADTDFTLTGSISSSQSNYYVSEYYNPTWTNETPAGETNTFQSVDVYSTTLAYAVGSGGRIYRWNGSLWTNETPDGESNTFQSVDVYSTTLAYAVGDTGRIYRWNGSLWTNERPSGQSNTFQSVDVYSTTLAYAVGQSGKIYRWNGSSWTDQTPSGEINILESVDVYSTTLAYAVGNAGRIYRGYGSYWTNETPSGESNTLESVDVYSTTLAYAVGNAGRIYKWSPATATSQYWTYWRVYQTANDGTGALGEPQTLKTNQISFTFPTSGPTTSDQMRHGNWFLNGIEQYFTF